jgi:16S rRNA (guanine527-N7)-methyltransferase
VTTPDFAGACADLAYALEGTQLRQLAAYRDLLVERAAQFNLTAVRDAAGVERRHLLESLALGKLLEHRGLLSPAAPRVIDVGSGAGLPGLPLKIAFPSLALTLLDANEKRGAFLREAVEALALSDVTVLVGRAEALAHDPAQRCHYDLALARAVAPLPTLLEYCVPFLVVGGRLVAQKGTAASRELAEAGGALRALAAEVEAVETLLPPGGRPQSVVVVRKMDPTPPELPRRVGVPSRRPLA